MNKTSVKGFTLLEVMIASVILISSIAAISISYRGALIASQRADNNIQVSGVMPVIMAQVSEGLQQLDKGETKLFQNGVSWGVKYQWQAELIDFKSPPERFDPDEGDFIVDQARFRLWLVDLQVEKGSVQQTYQFNELSWLDEKR
ncbi:MAG: prepilin-type N-terminal cleavage/methylation domain-containing protein [Paraglaciecola sp.]|jgi:prepilin-type N-terminal cleavage/methylation domain-containing protein